MGASNIRKQATPQEQIDKGVLDKKAWADQKKSLGA